ncbi:MAG: NUDIX domain-containing protein [Candidatus Liptonbacteria bacterium]|nr:NUDIX domain-containing protein [Candidatus Liptonbacteria bacterium]
MKISKDAQGVVYRKDGQVLFLVLKRFDPDKNETHFRLIKGRIREKEEESSEAAVLREIQEEAGLSKARIVGKIFDYSYDAGDVKHEVRVFLVESLEKEQIVVDSKEEGAFTIEGASWLTPEEALEKLNFEVEKNVIRKALEML